jgi:hypothetical protein
VPLPDLGTIGSPVPDVGTLGLPTPDVGTLGLPAPDVGTLGLPAPDVGTLELPAPGVASEVAAPGTLPIGGSETDVTPPPSGTPTVAVGRHSSASFDGTSRTDALSRDGPLRITPRDATVGSISPPVDERSGSPPVDLPLSSSSSTSQGGGRDALSAVLVALAMLLLTLWSSLRERAVVHLNWAALTTARPG